MKNLLLLVSIFFVFTPYMFAQSDTTAWNWASAMYNQMSLDEKIGQLFMIRAYSRDDQKHINYIKKTIVDHNLGGLCFFQGTPEKQIELINTYQAISKYPLLISMDAEWGTGMRFKEDGFSFPKQLTLGAVQDDQLIYEMGQEVAAHLQKVGTQLNFAPVVDINNNPKNPVINVRSFGEDKYNVSRKAFAYAKGMEDAGVLACMKHFPGHGDTDVDSHLDLPIITHDMQRLKEIEMFPFKQLGQQGISSVMVAHLSVPAIDATPNLPTTLASKAVTDILINEFDYKGLIFTDALDMKGVSKFHKNGDAEAKAFLAGNDVLLLPEDIPNAKAKIKEYLKKGTITEERLARSVKKILYYKHRTGLHRWKELPNKDIRKFLNRPQAQTIKRKIYRAAMTLAKNDKNLVPIEALKPKLVSLAFGASSKTDFQKRLDSYAQVEAFQINSNSNPNASLWQNKLKEAEMVIASFHDMSSYASRKYGIAQSHVNYLEKLAKEKKVIVVLFGTPYALHYFDGFETVLQAYEEAEEAQDIAAQGLFGVYGFEGALPITASKEYQFNQGVWTRPLGRVGFSLPEDEGMNSDFFYKIDSLANKAIDMQATPGCVVLASKNGNIVFEKAYGYHTYNKQIPMQINTIFDVASITKVAATTVSLMKLQEMGKVDVSKPLGEQLSVVKNSNKNSLILEDILRHRARLYPWLRFYEATLYDPKTNPFPNKAYYQNSRSTEFPMEVTEKLFLKKGYRDTILQGILLSELNTKKEYKYSDLGMILMDRLVEEQSGMRIDSFAYKNFYQPLGMERTTFNAAKKFSLKEIPPTEVDNYFRQQTVQGYVHDMAAAMLDGVSGHAGLFSTAEDLNALFTMLLNKGHFAGKQYLDEATIERFTMRCDSCTRRGIGFDMKQLDTSEIANMSPLASDETFGHLGFTGTAVWADPQHDFIYIFLSNRTFPSMKNNLLGEEDFRPKIQSVFYEAMGVSDSL